MSTRQFWQFCISGLHPAHNGSLSELVQPPPFGHHRWCFWWRRAMQHDRQLNKQPFIGASNEPGTRKLALNNVNLLGHRSCMSRGCCIFFFFFWGGRRTVACTLWPMSRSCWTTWLAINPLAPVTKDMESDMVEFDVYIDSGSQIDTLVKLFSYSSLDIWLYLIMMQWVMKLRLFIRFKLYDLPAPSN